MQEEPRGPLVSKFDAASLTRPWGQTLLIGDVSRTVSRTGHFGGNSARNRAHRLSLCRGKAGSKLGPAKPRTPVRFRPSPLEKVLLKRVFLFSTGGTQSATGYQAGTEKRGCEPTYRLARQRPPSVLRALVYSIRRGLSGDRFRRRTL
jgi:hypothetical protein